MIGLESAIPAVAHLTVYVLPVDQSHCVQAAKTAGKDSTDGYFDVSMLDGFVRRSVQLGAFDHIR